MKSSSASWCTGAALLALLLNGCPSPELGEAPFYCHNGKPECPEGYTCENVGGEDVCVKAGSVPPRLDGSVAPGDGAVRDDLLLPLPDGPVVKQDATVPQPGQVVITEFTANPDAVLDNNGEWIELFNMGDYPVDINGWTIRDNDSDLHKITAIGSLEVPAKGYLLLGRTTDKAINGGVNVAYSYGQDLSVANSDDEIFLMDASGNQVDGFSYSVAAGFTIPTGASLSVNNPAGDKNQPTTWCVETAPWPGSLGDKGTPGSNPGCQ